MVCVFVWLFVCVYKHTPTHTMLKLHLVKTAEHQKLAAINFKEIPGSRSATVDAHGIAAHTHTICLRNFGY
jgi:hypothetical protein